MMYQIKVGNSYLYNDDKNYCLTVRGRSTVFSFSAAEEMITKLRLTNAEIIGI